MRAAKRARYIYHPIDTNMDAYAELTLMEIRKYLTYTYQPQHSWAHIPDRIAEYSADQELVSIIGQLERAEYSRQELTSDEKEQIQRELLMKIKT